MQTQEQVLAAAKKWRAIYPSYIDATLTASEGRRIGKDHCPAQPQLMEISEALSKLGLQHVVEGHRFYSKDILKAGRIKVRILTDDKKPYTQITHKHALLKNIAKYIKSIPNRKLPQQQEEQHMEIEQPTKKKNKK